MSPSPKIESQTSTETNLEKDLKNTENGGSAQSIKRKNCGFFEKKSERHGIRNYNKKLFNQKDWSSD